MSDSTTNAPVAGEGSLPQEAPAPASLPHPAPPAGPDASSVEVATADIHPIHGTLDRLFKQLVGPDGHLLEVGCRAGSRLPLVALQRRCEAWGIDVAPAHLEAVRTVADTLGASVHLVQGDILDAEALPKESFDVVYSASFLELFPDAEEITRRFHQLLKPGGHVITLVPNLQGLLGWIHRKTDHLSYRERVAYTPASLDRVHRESGLTAVHRARYHGTLTSHLHLGRPMGLPPWAWRMMWWSTDREYRGSELSRRGEPDWLSTHLLGVYRRAEDGSD